MSDELELADRFAALLSSGDSAGAEALLAADVQFLALGRKLQGRADVLPGLAQPLYGRQQWHKAVRADGAGTGAVRLAGRARDAADPGLVLTLAIRDGRIERIEQQRTPPAPPPAQPLALTPALKQLIDSALVTRHPMLVAHVEPDGQPVLSFRGSIQVFADDALSMWVRNPDGRMIAAIARNPRLALMYRNEDTKATYQFHGRARIATDSAERQRVYERAPEAERHHDFARLGVAVVIELDRVEGYAGLGPAGAIDRVLMLRSIQA